MVVEYKVDPDKQFQNAIKKVLKDIDDLTIPFQLMTQSWFKSNLAIFALKGPGKYSDLNEKYKKRKKTEIGFVYPILKKSGALAASITQPGNTYSIAQVINKKTLVLGSNIPYGAVHQFGSSAKNIKKRPWILLGSEQVAPSGLNKRREAWIEILEDFVKQKTLPLGEVK